MLERRCDVFAAAVLVLAVYCFGVEPDGHYADCSSIGIDDWSAAEAAEVYGRGEGVAEAVLESALGYYASIDILRGLGFGIGDADEEDGFADLDGGVADGQWLGWEFFCGFDGH